MKMSSKHFRIGELAKELGIERFVIRFWEKEFDINSPRSTGGQRFYTEKDLALFKQLKKLLYDEGFTIAGAKKALKTDSNKIIASRKTTFEQESQKMESTTIALELKDKLHDMQKQLLKLRELLY